MHNKPGLSLILCKNCGQEFNGKYCNVCGQDAHTGKIDMHFLVHEVQHGLFHVDKGILFTLKELFTRPGYTIREYIAGKRVNHFKPLAFLIVTAGLYAFIYHFIVAGSFIGFRSTDVHANNAIEKVNEWSKTHYTLLVLLQLPILSGFFYMVFKKYGTSYPEQLVINAYLSGQRILIKLVLLPLFYILPHSTFNILFVVSDIIIPIALFVWVYCRFYTNERGITIAARTLLAFVLNYITVVIIISGLLTLMVNNKFA